MSGGSSSASMTECCAKLSGRLLVRMHVLMQPFCAGRHQHIFVTPSLEPSDGLDIRGSLCSPVCQHTMCCDRHSRSSGLRWEHTCCQCHLLLTAWQIQRCQTQH